MGELTVNRRLPSQLAKDSIEGGAWVATFSSAERDDLLRFLNGRELSAERRAELSKRVEMVSAHCIQLALPDEPDHVESVHHAPESWDLPIVYVPVRHLRV